MEMNDLYHIYGLTWLPGNDNIQFNLKAEMGEQWSTLSFQRNFLLKQ